MMTRTGILAKAFMSFCLYAGLASCAYESNTPLSNTDAGTMAPGVPQITDVSSSPISGGASMLTITGKNLQKASFVINNAAQSITSPANSQDTKVIISVDEKTLSADPIVGVTGVASIYAFSASGAGPIKKFNYFQPLNSITFPSSEMNNELGVSGFIDQDGNADRVAVGGTGKSNHIYVNVMSKPQQDIMLSAPGAQVLWVVLADMDGDRLADLVFTYIDGTSTKVKLGIYRNNTAAASPGINYFDASANLAEGFDTQLPFTNGGYAYAVVNDVNRNGIADVTLIVTSNTSAMTKTFFR